MPCQTKVKAFGYRQMLWHLFSSFHVVHISMKFKVVRIQALNQPSISNDFESKLLELKLGMNSQLISVLTPFWAFLAPTLMPRHIICWSSSWTLVLKDEVHTKLHGQYNCC